MLYTLPLVALKLNATTASVSDIRTVVETAKRNIELYNKRTILFLDEIHRFNKKCEEYIENKINNKEML